MKESGKFPQTFDLLNRLGSTQLQCLGAWEGGLFLSKGRRISWQVQIFPKRFRKWLTILKNLISSNLNIMRPLQSPLKTTIITRGRMGTHRVNSNR